MIPYIRERMAELTDQNEMQKLRETLNSMVKDYLDEGFEGKDIYEYLADEVNKSIKEFE